MACTDPCRLTITHLQNIPSKQANSDYVLLSSMLRIINNNLNWSEKTVKLENVERRLNNNPVHVVDDKQKVSLMSYRAHVESQESFIKQYSNSIETLQ